MPVTNDVTRLRFMAMPSFACRKTVWENDCRRCNWRNGMLFSPRTKSTCGAQKGLTHRRLARYLNHDNNKDLTLRLKSRSRQSYRLCFDQRGSFARKRQRGTLKVTAILAVVVGAIAAFVLRSPTGHRLVDTHIDARDRGLTVASSVSLPALRASVNDTLEYFDVNVKPWHRASQALATSGTWQTVAVVAGDNMALIFSRLGLARGMLQAILDSGPEANRLRDIRPGQEVRFRVAGDQVLEMILDIDLESMLHVVKEDSGFRSRLLVTEPDRRVATATATIEDSLFLAGQKAGISDNVLMQLVDIFGWDIDFLLDIRVGDSYAVVYEELFKDGKKVKDGRVLAAEFVNQNR
ncbi:MAG: hypothetical protein IT494_00265, partial [Gammaproteobacteria bacterium]|nr:hypothetical protein [Gammaproteobacteria bacterium]